MATTRTRRRGTLPPVEVECPECGRRWSSTAQRHTPVHCARCGHSVRVKREPGAQAAIIAASAPPPRAVPLAAIRPAGVVPVPATQVVPELSRPVPLPSPGADADDDGETWLYDDRGVLVLGEWTWDRQAHPGIPGAYRLCSRAGRPGLAARDESGRPGTLLRESPAAARSANRHGPPSLSRPGFPCHPRRCHLR